MFKKISVLGLVLIGLSACGVSEDTSSEQSSLALNLSSSEVSSSAAEELSTATVEVVVDEEIVETTDVTFEEGDFLQDVMIEQLDATVSEGFLSAIGEYEQSETENKWWMYTVNQEEITVGAGEFVLEDGDTVVWELTQF